MHTNIQMTIYYYGYWHTYFNLNINLRPAANTFSRCLNVTVFHFNFLLVFNNKILFEKRYKNKP